MLTPSELRNAQFPKARLGGYVMAEVDKLLDQVTPDYESLYSENAELRKKVEVLLDRLDHYQEQEDSIKAAILNAQRMCDTIVAQAKQQAALIEQDAKIKAGRVAEEAQRSIQDKHDELEAIRQEVTKFRSNLVALYRSHLEKIKEIPSFAEETVEQPASDCADLRETPPAEVSDTAATQAQAATGAATQDAPAQETVSAAGLEPDMPQTAAEQTTPAPEHDPSQQRQAPDFEKTMEFTPPRLDESAWESSAGQALPGQERPAAIPASEQIPAAKAVSFQGNPASLVVEILDDDTPVPYLSSEPASDEEVDYSGIHSLNLEDSLEFGSEFDIATGRRR